MTCNPNYEWMPPTARFLSDVAIILGFSTLAHTSLVASQREDSAALRWMIVAGYFVIMVGTSGSAACVDEYLSSTPLVSVGLALSWMVAWWRAWRSRATSRGLHASPPGADDRTTSP